MSCADFLTRMQMLLDQHRDPLQDETLCRHASRCEACCERLASQERLFMVLSAAASEWCGAARGARDAFAVDARCEVRRGGRLPRGFLRLMAFSVATSAALIAITVIAWPRATSSANGRLANSGGGASGVQHSRPTRDLSKRPAGESIAIARSGGGLRGRETQPVPQMLPAETSKAGSFSLGNRLTLGGFEFAAETRLISTFYDTLCKAPPIPDQSVPQVDQLADEFKPLAQPFMSVLNVLMRTLPGAKSPAFLPFGGETSRFVRRFELA